MLTVEQSQMITDLRRRMYDNVQNGRPSFDGLTEDEVRLALDAVRGNRSVAASAAAAKSTKTRTKKAKEVGTPQVPRAGGALEKFSKFDLD